MTRNKKCGLVQIGEEKAESCCAAAVAQAYRHPPPTVLKTRTFFISRCQHPEMASIAASRARLQQRKNAVNKAEEAIEKADEVYSALYTRQEERRRREYSDCDSEDRDEDEDEDGEPKGDGDENENVEDKGSDYADEEEEGFDFDAKSERLADEVMRCKVEAQKAQRRVCQAAAPPTTTDLRV